MTTILEVPFYYPATVIPKRARKEREVFLTAALSLPIPDLKPEDAPIVMETELEYDFVVQTGDSLYDSEWRHKLVPVQFRRNGNKLLRPFDAVYQCGYEVPETFSVSREHAPELFQKILKTMNGFYDFEVLSTVEPIRRDTYHEVDFVGKILTDQRDDRAHRLSQWVNDYGLVFIEDVLWRQTELPVWTVGYEHLKPEGRSTFDRGSRRYLRPVPYESCKRVEDAYWHTELSRSTFTKEMTEQLEYSRAARRSLEVAPERGHVTVVGELPFGRNEVLQKLYECVAYQIEYSRGVPQEQISELQALLGLYDNVRRDEEIDPAPFVKKLVEFNEIFSKLPINKSFNPLSYRLEKIERMLPSSSPEPQSGEPLKPFSHRARRANGYDTVPAQALVPVEHNETIIFIHRDEARLALAALSAEDGAQRDVKTYEEVFQVDGLPAFRATGSVTLKEPPMHGGSEHNLSDILENEQLDILARCDWETWRRGAGTVLRPDGTGGMVARIWVKRDYASHLYIFLNDRYTYEAIEFIDKVGDAKQLCEAALEAYGFGSEYFEKHFGDIFSLKRDRLAEPQAVIDADLDEASSAE